MAKAGGVSYEEYQVQHKKAAAKAMEVICAMLEDSDVYRTLCGRCDPVFLTMPPPAAITCDLCHQKFFKRRQV